jgi:hypothetical protein
MSSSQRENSDSDSEATLPWKINLDQTEVEEIQTKVELLKEYKKIAELWKRMTVPTKLRRDIYSYIDQNEELESRMIREIIMKSNPEGQFSDEMYLTPRPYDFTRLGRMWDDLKKAIDEIHVIEYDGTSKKRRVEKRE